MYKFSFKASFIFLLASSSCIYGQTLEQFFQAADGFMYKYVADGQVNYRAIKANKKDIGSLTNFIGKADLSEASSNEKKAFYINAYNLLVIESITNYYPIKSALDKNGFFKSFKHKIAGEALTLDEIEKKRILFVYNDPRVHFALACAAKGCPKLASNSYKPANLDTQLDKQASNVLNDPTFIRVKSGSNSVMISQIFEWYKKDFLGTGLTYIQYINQFRNQKIPSDYQVSFYEYDWDLNDQS